MKLRALHVQALYLLYACEMLPVKENPPKRVFYKARLRVNVSRCTYTVYDTGEIEWRCLEASVESMESSSSINSMESAAQGPLDGRLSPRVRS